MHRIFILILSLFSTVCVFSQTVNVGVMLPLHDVDGDGRRMVEYYRGILMAVDRRTLMVGQKSLSNVAEEDEAIDDGREVGRKV